MSYDFQGGFPRHTFAYSKTQKHQCRKRSLKVELSNVQISLFLTWAWEWCGLRKEKLKKQSQLGSIRPLVQESCRNHPCGKAARLKTVTWGRVWKYTSNIQCLSSAYLTSSRTFQPPSWQLPFSLGRSEAALPPQINTNSENLQRFCFIRNRETVFLASNVFVILESWISLGTPSLRPIVCTLKNA